MGKAAILLMISALIAGAFILFNAEQTNFATLGDQAERQEQIVAREIARSGYNSLKSRAREVERNLVALNPNTTLAQVINEVNGEDGVVVGPYEGGEYHAWMEPTSLQSYRIHSEGYYGSASHTLDGSYVPTNMLAVPDDGITADSTSFLNAEFISSMAGWCSAIYLERHIPKYNYGHGTQVDGCNPNNPGNKNCPEDSEDQIDRTRGSYNAHYHIQEPELIFASGRNRDGTRSHLETELIPGTRLNFILAVDKGCNLQGDDTVAYDDPGFDHRHYALVNEGSNAGLDDMREGMYAMLEAHSTESGVWRIAFEDQQRWGEAEFQDIKDNAYPDPLCASGGACGKSFSFTNGTYGGEGWGSIGIDAMGYTRLLDYGNIPDFSDQVFQIWLTEDLDHEHTPGQHASR